MKKFKIAEFIATFLYVGKKARFCPGTIGSVATLPMWFLIILFITHYKLCPFLTIPPILVLVFAGGYWSTKVYLEETKQDDPKEVVIDEVMGQLIAYTISAFSFVICLIMFNKFSQLTTQIGLFCFLLMISPVILFRIFDIKKPLWIGRIDKNMKNAMGVMLDDVVAGVFAGIINSILIIMAIIWLL